MNEDEWLTCEDMPRMYQALSGGISPRKHRLFHVGCLRRVSHLTSNEGARGAIDRLEQIAEGQEGNGAAHLGLFLRTLSQATTGLPPAARAAFSADAAGKCRVLRDVHGNPFRPVTVDPLWLTPTVVAIARRAYDEREFAVLPILGDALEEAGCTNADVLAHCRGPDEHFRGCWVVDLILGKQ